MYFNSTTRWPSMIAGSLISLNISYLGVISTYPIVLRPSQPSKISFLNKVACLVSSILVPSNQQKNKQKHMNYKTLGRSGLKVCLICRIRKNIRRYLCFLSDISRKWVFNLRLLRFPTVKNDEIREIKDIVSQ